MIYNEIEQDLFKVNDELVTPDEPLYDLAHCISADFAMAGGIAVEFNRRWDMKNRLITKCRHVFPQFDFTQGFAISENVGQFQVYNLVTKRHVEDLPTIYTIENALVSMKQQMKQSNSHRVAMPLIGCGIDRQNWNDVKAAIQKVFGNTNIEVLICRMPKTNKIV